ncbi:MAG: hypothetical protein AAFV43_08830 [Planctomycetota bacterium]
MTSSRRILRVAGSLVLACAATVATADRVRTTSGSIAGEVVEESRRGVVVETDRGRVSAPIGEIVGVIYEGEPVDLARARMSAAGGGFASVIDRLASLDDTPGLTAAMRREADFLRSVSAVRQAIFTGAGAKAAGRDLTAFLRENNDSRFYYPAVEALADLLADLGRTDTAVKRYRLLVDDGVAPFDAQARVAIGVAYQRAERHEEAVRGFAAALAAVDPETDLARAAMTGRTVSRAYLGQADEALAAARDAVRSAGEDTTQLAAAYNTLGRVYLAAERPRDALYALLHTDLLYNDDAATHAEALSLLAAVWRDAGRRAEADDARERLRRRYARTVWARRVRDG